MKKRLGQRTLHSSVARTQDLHTQSQLAHSDDSERRADYFDMNIRGKIDTLMQKRISDYTDRSRTCRRPYLKSITGYQEDIGRTNDGGACLTLFYMKTVRQLTLTVITALFVVTAALLWASAPAKVSATNQVNLCLRATLPNRSRIAGGPISLCAGLISSAVARIRYRDFRPGFRPEIIRCSATSMEMETSTSWLATVFLDRRAFLF